MSAYIVLLFSIDKVSLDTASFIPEQKEVCHLYCCLARPHCLAHPHYVLSCFSKQLSILFLILHLTIFKVQSLTIKINQNQHQVTTRLRYIHKWNCLKLFLQSYSVKISSSESVSCYCLFLSLHLTIFLPFPLRSKREKSQTCK